VVSLKMQVDRKSGERWGRGGGVHQALTGGCRIPCQSKGTIDEKRGKKVGWPRMRGKERPA